MAEKLSKRQQIRAKFGEKLESSKSIEIPFLNNTGEEISDKDKVFSAIKEVATPNIIKEKPRHVQVNEKYYRIRTVADWPKEVTVGFLNDILKSDADIDLSLRINPIDQVEARESLETAINYRQQQKEMKIEDGKQVPATLDTEIKDLTELKTKLDRGSESLFDISLSAMAKGKDQEQLDKNSRTIKHKLNSINLVSKVPGLKQLIALKAAMPTGKNKLDNRKKVPTNTAVGMFPFTTKYAEIDKTGIAYGVNRETGNLVVKDNYQFTNPNWFIVATSGAGKSYTAKLKIINDHIKGVKNHIIDPHGEYGALIRELNGQDIELSPHSANNINPLDMMGHTYREKLLALNELYELMFPDLGSSQKRKIMGATKKAYRKKGISKDKPTTENHAKEMPTMSDLLQELEIMKAEEKDGKQRSSYTVAIGKVDKYVSGAFDFFDTETQLTTDAQIINFNIEKLPKQSWPIAMYLITNYLYSQMTEGSTRRKQLVVDEGWKLLEGLGGGDQSFLKDMVKSSRKYNLSLGLLIQNVEDLVNNEQAGDAIMANTAMKIMMKQDDTVLPGLAKELHLNQQEKDLLRTADTGEALMIADGERIPLEVIASDEVHELITTDPAEMEKLEKEGALEELEQLRKDKNTDEMKEANNGEEVKESMYGNLEENSFPERSYYLEKKLTDRQKNIMENNPDWEKSSAPVFGKGRGRNAWVKCKGNISADHEKVVHKIKQHIDNNFETENVQTTRKKADLEIEKDGKKLAIEIETGKNAENSYDERLKKKKTQNDEEYDKWVILTLDYGKKDEYSEYAPTYTRGTIKKQIGQLLN